VWQRLRDNFRWNESGDCVVLDRIFDYAKTTLLVTLIGGFLLFCGDWLVVLYKIARHDAVIGVVTVHRTVTASLKNGKYDIYAMEPVDETCLNSLFPHQGYTPCWYLRRHSEQITSY
jgi:hypothetical protein